jgi:glycosyltransferase involved in cell wall biosynthesis
VSYDGPGTCTRFKLKFNSGVLFYAELQMAIYRWLKRNEYDCIWSNDLDTLLPAVLAGGRKGVPVIYDSHEYFTEAAGLTHSPLKRRVWLAIEKMTVPYLGQMITVNSSIADKYTERYGIKVNVVRNMPELSSDMPQMGSRSEFENYGVPTDLPILLMQGAFMDRDRGAAEAVSAVRKMEGVRLVLVGAGVEWDEAVEMVNESDLKGKLFCIPRLPYIKLKKLTASADVGLSLDKALHENYTLSLPNKLFDFIHAGLPVVASPMVELKKIVEANNIGIVTSEVNGEAISDAVFKVLKTPRKQWFDSCMKARQNLHWGTDSHVILEILDSAKSQSWVRK